MTDTNTPLDDAIDTDTDVLRQVASSYPKIQDDIQELDQAKKPLSKQLNSHKRTVKKVLKRKLEELQEDDSTVTEVVVQMGNTTFRLEQVEKCPPCKVDDLYAFFDREHVEQYIKATRKKRLKLSVD